MKRDSKPMERFVLNFRASIGKWKMDDETVTLWLDKLSKWKLSADEWSRALSRVIADNEKGELLPLPTIYRYLKEAQSKHVVTGSGYGWMTFLKDGKPHAIKIISKDGAWVFASCITKDRFGQEEILQKHPGEPAVAPAGATDIHFVPDEPAHEDYITGIEARHYFAQGYAESGGPPELLETMFNTLVQR